MAAGSCKLSALLFRMIDQRAALIGRFGAEFASSELFLGHKLHGSELRSGSLRNKELRSSLKRSSLQATSLPKMGAHLRCT